MKHRLFYLLMVVPLAGCGPTDQPFPPQDRLLGLTTSGGWLNIDFIHAGAPADEAQRCVQSHGRAHAVACFAFASEEAYQLAQPIEAGNFGGPLCWDARWQRNKAGMESGGANNARPSVCPPSKSEPSTSTAEEKPLEDAGVDVLNVAIDFDTEKNPQGQLRISGTTNLPDDTRLSFSLSQTTENFFAQDSGEVRNGRFQSTWFSKQGGRLPSGSYEIGVIVSIYNTQPESVQRQLGPGLEAMTGPLVEHASPEFLGKVASLQRKVEIP